MKRMMVLCAALLAAPFLLAVDAVWTNESTSVQIWTTTGNWTNAETGAELELPPTNAADTVTFPFIDITRRTVKFCGDVDAAKGSFAVASVAGPRHWQLVMPGYSYSWSNARRTFTVDDVNGFAGSWAAEGPHQTIALTASSGVQTLETVSAASRMIINVQNADVEAKINHVRDAGAIEKKGPGKLTLGTMHHESHDVYLREGELELAGVADDEDAVCAEAVIHLDASRRDTMKGYTGDDGRYYVTNWAHASGGEVCAELWDNSAETKSSIIRYPHAPFLNATDVSSTGLPLMDFGAVLPDKVDELGPTNCTLRFSQRITNVREVFYVDLHSDPVSVSNYSLCDDSSYIFSGNTVNAFKYESAALTQGRVFFNGLEAFAYYNNSDRVYRFARPQDNFSPAWSNLTLTSVSLAQNVSLHYLCADRLFVYPSGGMRVGEILVFTNVLSSAQRDSINARLLRKWFAGAAKDVSTLHVANSATAAVTVPAGHTVKIANVVLKGKTLVKKGAGTLEIGAIEPADATVDVRAGRVKVTSAASEISSSAPAGTPLFWYDGDAADTFVESEDGITKWKDHRTELSRSASSTTDRALPTNLTVTINGKTHTVVDFVGSGSTGSYMTMPYRKDDSSVAKQKESFIVMSFRGSSQLYPIFGTEKENRNARSWYNILNPDVCMDDWGGASATVNGVPIDPFGGRTDATTPDFVWSDNTWYVISLAGNTSGDGFVRRLGGDNATSRNGNVQIGEYIGYDTALTPAERRDTIAYLMKKWLNQDHPEIADRGTPAYVYADDEPVRIVTDDDVTIRGYTGGNGTIVKEGDGKATLADYVSSFTNLSVTGGELELTRAGFADKSAIHLDASDLSSFTTYLGPDGATNITRWADVRGNGAYAGDYSSSTIPGTNALVQTVETRTGESRTVVDFRMGRDRDGAKANRDGAALIFDGDHRLKNVVEAHEIFSDAHGCHGATTFGNHWDNAFYRGTFSAWFRSWSGSQVVNGYLAVDGSPVTYSANIGDGFHLLSIAPTSTVSVSGLNLTSGNDYIGGCYVGELLVYTTALTPIERTYLQQSLMRKWYGSSVPVPEWTNEVASVTVLSGAKMTCAPGSVIRAPKVVGSGEIEATALCEVATLELETADGQPQPLAVTGGISFAPAVTLKLGAGLRRIREGDYEILTATGAIEGADSSAWTIVSDASAYRKLSVICEANILKLRVRKPGMVILVK